MYTQKVIFGAGIPDAILEVINYDNIRLNTSAYLTFKGSDYKFNLDLLLLDIDLLKENYDRYKLLNTIRNNRKSITKGYDGSYYEYIIKLGFETNNGVAIRDIEFNIDTDKKLRAYIEGLQNTQMRVKHLENTELSKKESKVDIELKHINSKLTLKEKIELIKKLSEQINKEVENHFSSGSLRKD